ncbi:glycoside hydrolase family 36 N-terminal domain-containing protein [Paractinoplanes durhamensis]|uniref:glycoside hydrolase family 36 N-terminal domain-containing protein n=1 Tax=Paractinoplanes durhamensis TaxID=113563 RepID=UPI003641E8C6
MLSIEVPVHWRADGVSLVLDCAGPLLPRVLHWGADLGACSEAELAGLALAAIPQQVSNNIDEVVPVSVLPEQSVGWLGTPGLTGHRDGAAFSTAFTLEQLALEGDRHRLDATARDAAAGLSLRLELEMTASGLLRQRVTLTNDDPGSTFTLDGVLLTLPVPTEAAELLDFTGRHLRERTPQRMPFTVGTRLRDNRRGRTGADASIVLAAGTAGFGFATGEVWGVHVAWSGNHRTLAERTSTGVSLLGGGELLLAGEVRLAPGEKYQSPWLYGSYGHGLDELSGRFHRYLRGRPQHPARPAR